VYLGHGKAEADIPAAKYGAAITRESSTSLTARGAF